MSGYNFLLVFNEESQSSWHKVIYTARCTVSNSICPCLPKTVFVQHSVIPH